MKVLIAGRGVSGKAAFKLCVALGFQAEFAEEKDLEINPNLTDKTYSDRLFNGLSFIISSPGISPDVWLLREAKKRNVRIVGELEFGASFAKGNIIAVTGTNGKTTTVSLISHILNGQKRKVFLGGNIGVPVSSFAKKTTKSSISVLECSSFQLDEDAKIHSHIAAILNITPDHLSRHKTMEAYIRAKQNITSFQTENDFLLLNADSTTLMENLPETKAKIFYFSTKQKVLGCYIKSGSIYFNDNQIEKKLVSLEKIKLIGEHNLSNILCAVLASYLETKNTCILERINSFEAISHRIEFVGQANEISFYNDSKATNIGSTLVALLSFKCRINLILGGSEKGYEFDELFAKLPKNVANIAVFGQTKPKIMRAARKFNYQNICGFDSLKSCTIYCKSVASPGEVVLLSPACASFDQFTNYEERGNVFKKIVREICLNENLQNGGKKET